MDAFGRTLPGQAHAAASRSQRSGPRWSWTALAVSAALKCQYCIPAHKQFALDAGATEEEIKIAVNIAAHVASGSTLFYGNEFDLELFKEGLEK